MIYGVCQSIKAENPSIQVHTTYLDPVAVFSGVMWDFGLHNFGTCADFSDSYVDVLDHVPGSNQALPNSITFDVTQVRIENSVNISPHVWPTEFYSQLYRKGKAPVYTGAESEHLVLNAIGDLLRENSLVKRIVPIENIE